MFPGSCHSIVSVLGDLLVVTTFRLIQRAGMVTSQIGGPIYHRQAAASILQIQPRVSKVASQGWGACLLRWTERARVGLHYVNVLNEHSRQLTAVQPQAAFSHWPATGWTFLPVYSSYTDLIVTAHGRMPCCCSTWQPASARA